MHKEVKMLALPCQILAGIHGIFPHVKPILIHFDPTWKVTLKTNCFQAHGRPQVRAKRG